MEYLFNELLNAYKDIWYSLEPLDIREIPDYSIKRKYNDRELISFKGKMLHLIKTTDNLKTLDNPKEHDLIRGEIESFLSHVFDIDTRTCDELFEDGYYTATKAFISRASETVDLPFEDIYQGLRNVWVMNSLQVYLNQPIELTDAVFGYSMLYPLTDNYLDDLSIPKEEKKSFNKRFYKKIKDNIDDSLNASEKLIFSMIDLISSMYTREEYPLLYKSLLAILDGQNKSIDQQDLSTIYDKDLLTYTFYKGGSSVLADAYLVKGHLSSDEEQFAFGYGVLLQLADDMQDIDSDLEAKHMTMMNTQATHSNIDGLYLKYEALVSYFFNQCFLQSNPKQIALYKLLRKSVELLSFGAVSVNKTYFSSSCYKQLIRKGYFSKKAYSKYNKKIMGSINY